MKVFSLFFLVFVCVIANAQTPFELFNSNSRYFFNQPTVTDELVGLKTDSVKISGSDTIYYHYKITDFYRSCLSAHAPSWLGFKTVRNINNEFIFFNNQNDSIILKPCLNVGSAWVFYRYSTGDYIKATITSKLYEPTYNGQFDSVKTISFQAYDNLGTAIINPYNSITFKVSKNDGIIKFGNMYNFPSNTNINSRCFGKLLTLSDLYNHEIGDVYQTYAYSGWYPGGGGGGAPVSSTYKSYNYINKTNPTPNSAQYQIQLTTQIIYHAGYYTNSLNTTTVTNNIYHLDSIIYNEMPQQFHRTTTLPSIYGNKLHYYYDATTVNNCEKKFRIFLNNCDYEYTSVTPNQDTCIIGSVSCPDPATRNIISGFGGFSASIFTGDPYDAYYYSKPIYSSSLAASCGTLVNVGINEEKQLLLELKIYPNPANSVLNVEFSSLDFARDYMLELTENPITIQIINNLGQIVLTEKINSHYTKININHLKDGLYYLCFKSKDKMVTQKLIIQK